MINAAVAELADALDSKSNGRKVMRVRPSPAAQLKTRLKDGFLFYNMLFPNEKIIKQQFLK